MRAVEARLNEQMDVVPDPALCAHLADDLTAAGYTSDRLRAAWGELADEALGHGLRGPALRALHARNDVLAVLGAFFGLGEPTTRAALDEALPSTGADGVAAMGLAVRRDDIVTPVALLRPQSFEDADGAVDWWVASDVDESVTAGPLREDHVLGVGGASLTLAGLMVTTRAGRLLDLGAGCGIQTLRGGRLAERFVATDISTRALAFTRLNALVNRAGSVETRHGSLFEPVRGETFDRIVSNPPFVITPRVDDVPRYEYRDGGMEGDDLVAAVVRDAGEHLAPGGIAQLLGNWEYREGEDGLDRVRQWVTDSHIPVDAWVIEREVADPLAYAELWVRDGGTAPGSPGYGELIGRWLDDFADRGVTGIGFGYVLLRRPVDGPPTLARFERVTQPLGGTLGAHLTAALAAHDTLENTDDATLLASTLVTAADVTEARHHVPGSDDPSVIELRQGGGLARSIAVDPALAALVGACDGDLTVGALIGAIAQLMEVDDEALTVELLPRVRELVFTGFLAFDGAAA